VISIPLSITSLFFDCLSLKAGERRVEILPISFNTTQVPSYLSSPSTSTLPPNLWVMEMREKKYRRFIELLTPPSDIKLLCYIFQLYEWGVKEFTQKDIYKNKSLGEWSAYYSLYRLQQKGIVKYKYTLPLQSGGRVKVYELNEENEIVQKLLGLFKVVVNGGENV